MKRARKKKKARLSRGGVCVADGIKVRSSYVDPKVLVNYGTRRVVVEEAPRSTNIGSKRAKAERAKAAVAFGHTLLHEMLGDLQTRLDDLSYELLTIVRLLDRRALDAKNKTKPRK